MQQPLGEFLPILRLGAASVPFYQIDSIIAEDIHFFLKPYLFLKGFVAQDASVRRSNL